MGSERDLVCVAPMFSFSAVPVSVVSFAGDSQVSPSPRAEWPREEMSRTMRWSLAEERQGDDDLY